MKDINFFERLLGKSKVEEILQEYVIKNYSGNEPKKSGRPLGSKNGKKKKKVFANGMRKWSEQDDNELIQSLGTLAEQGLSRNKAFEVIGKRFGVTSGAVHAHYQKITKRNGQTTIQHDRERVQA